MTALSNRRRLAVVVLALAASTATACSAGPSPAAAPQPGAFAGITPPVTDPLIAYSQPTEAIVSITQAVDLIAAKCMKSFGFDEYEAQDYEELRQSFQTSDSRLYGITDANVATIYGFMPAPTQGNRAVASAVVSSDAYQLVLAGIKDNTAPTPETQSVSPGTVNGLSIPAGGCLGDARRQVTGDVNGAPPASGELANGLRHQAFDEAWQDARTEAAKAEWAKCMSDSGYARADPLKDDVHVSNGDESPAPPDEVQQALTDIKCKLSTDFITKVNTVHVEHAQKLLETNQLALQEAKAFFDNSLAKANAVVLNG